MAANKINWRDIHGQIYRVLDIAAEFEALGVHLANGRTPNAKGWIECHAINCQDRSPSAGVCVSDGEYPGRYSDFRDPTRSCFLLEFAVRCNKGTFGEVLKHYAHKANVNLPNAEYEWPGDRLDFRTPSADPSFFELKQYAEGKAGVTARAIKEVGAKAASMPKNLPPEKRNNVFAFPMYGTSALIGLDPTGWHCVASHPAMRIRKYRGPGNPEEFIKTQTFDKYGLMNVDGLRRLAEATVVNLVEGITDLLTGQAVLGPWRDEAPAGEDRKHVVLSAGSCSYRPKPEWLQHFAGKEIRLWFDVGDPKNEGQTGAAVWAVSLLPVAKAVRNVQLPLGKDGGKNDLRAWLTDGTGRGYDEMDKYAQGCNPLTEATDELKSLAASRRQQTGSDPDDRPEIELSLDEFETNEQAAEALGNDQSVFQRGGLLVHLVHDDGIEKQGIRRPAGLPRIVSLPKAIIRERLTAVARFVKVSQTDDGEKRTRVPPPEWCINAVHQRGQWPAVRTLTGIVNCPTLRPNGTIFATPGYDSETGLYLESCTSFPPVSDHPSLKEAVAAGEFLQEVVCDFPFKSLEHKTGWIALVLTLLARHAFDGPAPLFLFDANTRGSGKGKLAHAAALIATGFEMAATAFPENDAEMRKVITSLAINGDNLVMLDNIEQELGGAALDAALTASRWRDRILGGNQIYDGPLTVTWVGTGNNVVVVGDSPRRILPMRLESLLEKPEERDNFCHPDLLGWIRSERPRLVVAGLTILRGYCAAGRPDQKLSPWGSFDGWSNLVRNAVFWSSLPDPCATRIDFVSRSDRDASVIRVMVEALARIAPGPPGFTAAELLDIAAGKRLLSEEGRLRDIEEGEITQADERTAAIRSAILEFCPAHKSDLPSSRSLGRKLSRAYSRVVGGKTIDSINSRGGIASWFTRSVGA